SMPPIYLSTLFIPDLFGTVTGYNNRNWVEAVTHGVRFWDANLSGGLLLTFLVLAGAFLAFKRGRLPRLRFWTVLGVLVWIFSILCVLGRHTPFYSLYYRVMPVYLLFPFPIRYRLLQVIATAWLAGLGMERLVSAKAGSTVGSRGVIWGYLSLAALAAVVSLFGFEGIRGLARGVFSPVGLAEIVRRGNLQWFISGPVLYFFAAGFFLLLAWRGLSGRRRAGAVAVLVLLETAIFAFAAFYFCIFRFYEPRPEHLRSLGPSTHPMIQRVLGPLAEFRDDPTLRWATDQPFYDDFARLEGSFALMGYDMKPLESRFKKAFEEAYGRPVDWPLYWDFPRPASPQFLSNMSVGCLLDSRPTRLFPGGEIEQLESNPDFYLHRNPSPLPRAFTLDRVVACSEAEAMNEVVKDDLRRGVFVEKGDRLSVIGNQLAGGRGDTDHRLPITDYRSFDPGPETEYLSHFARLQAANPITRLDLGNPNRVEVDLTITEPAMLVLTEVWYPGWEARVDGEAGKLFRVNYLQRGVWLAEGKHRVELNFRPLIWRIGLAISAAAGIILLLLFGISSKRRVIMAMKNRRSERRRIDVDRKD
ncbi:MAG: YfhO family protein, partial [Candidatus Erginobacter occultus]|nr:YfhO family protein [Candidatus Erginobacter occultus]